MNSAIHSIHVPQAAKHAIERRLALNPELEAGVGLTQALIGFGFLTERDCVKVAAEMKRRGKSFSETAVAMRLLRKEQLQIGLAAQYGYLNLTDDLPPPPSGMTVIRQPSSKTAEQIRKLRMRLITEQNQHSLNLFSIAPVAGNVRAEYLAVNLAVSFAQLKRRVLLVDADLRRPRIGKFLGYKPQHGLSDVLSGHIDSWDALQDNVVRNLTVLTAGYQKYDPQEVMANNRLEHVLREFCGRFDIVMALSAPATRDADARLVWANTRRALVVVRQHVSRYAELKSLRTACRQLDVQLLGAAMTQ